MSTAPCGDKKSLEKLSFPIFTFDAKGRTEEDKIIVCVFHKCIMSLTRFLRGSLSFNVSGLKWRGTIPHTY